MSAPDGRPRPRGGEPGDPVFAEPWQAEVLAIADGLIENGVFTAGAWAETLGAELARRVSAGEPDTEEGYYRAALAALESLVARASSITDEALADRVEAWRQAYHETPHGQPVVLPASR